jgi:hypothetical protein
VDEVLPGLVYELLRPPLHLDVEEVETGKVPAKLSTTSPSIMADGGAV